MTREEAITQLDGLLWDVRDRKCGHTLPYLTHADLDAIRIALGALRETGEYVTVPVYQKCATCTAHDGKRGHRHAPKALQELDVTVWPEPKPDDWCMEWVK